MEAGEHQLAERRRPAPLVFQPPTQVNSVTSGNASLLDPLELEALMLNMDASLKVHARHHFFTWTQGLLQNLLKHEMLICALRNSKLTSFHVDSFATSPAEPAPFSDMFRQDTSVVPHLIKTWEDNYFQPVICETGNESAFAGSALARELSRIGANVVLAHGTYDLFGKPASFFTFACQSGTIGPRQAYLAELVVPFLHLAWVRTQINRPAESDGASSPGASAQAECSEPHAGCRQGAGAAHSQYLSAAAPPNRVSLSSNHPFLATTHSTSCHLDILRCEARRGR